MASATAVTVAYRPFVTDCTTDTFMVIAPGVCTDCFVCTSFVAGLGTVGSGTLVTRRLVVILCGVIFA